MTTEVVSSPEYSRSAPPEWVSVAHEAMVSSGQKQPTPEAINTVFDAVEALDNELSESAHYYGLGSVMCGLARSLQDPVARQEVTAEAADSLLRYRRVTGVQNAQGLVPSNIRHMEVPFMRLALSASKTLPRWELLASDVLQADRSRRSQLAEGLESGWSLERDHDHAITKGTRTAEVVGNNATAAAGSVLSVALRKLQARDTDGQISASDNDNAQAGELSEYEEAIGPVLPIVTAQRTAVQSLALRCAVLRKDEFLRDLDEYIDLDANGTLIFRRDRKVSSQELAPPVPFKKDRRLVVVLHNKRLKCPAIYIEGLIPMMVDIVNDAVVMAQGSFRSIS